jgi:hypothetical protein
MLSPTPLNVGEADRIAHDRAMAEIEDEVKRLNQLAKDMEEIKKQMDEVCKESGMLCRPKPDPSEKEPCP